MKALARGVFEDLKRRRLLPVAALLVVALVALPMFMLKSSAPAPAPAAPAAVTAAAPDGLPSPNQVLGSEKPLVTLAVLNEASDLDEFGSKNPFKPIDQVSTDGATSDKAPSSAPTSAGTGSSTNSTATADTGPSGGGGTGGGGRGGAGTGTGGSDKNSTPTAPTTTPNAPTPAPAPAPKLEKLTYALDATLAGPSRVVRYRGVPKTQGLPSQKAPLFIFLGVDDTGNRGVFLIDSTLTVVGGEGKCMASNQDCATLSLEPGQIMIFKNDAGAQYQLRIDQIREVSVASAARAQTRRLKAAEESTSSRSSGARRFVPPLMIDLFTGDAS